MNTIMIEEELQELLETTDNSILLEDLKKIENEEELDYDEEDDENIEDDEDDSDDEEVEGDPTDEEELEEMEIEAKQVLRESLVSDYV